MMKKIIPLFTTLLLLGWSMNAWSFACKTATGATIPIGGGSANVYVNLTPAVNVGQNLVVDLSTQIFCHKRLSGNDHRLRDPAARIRLWRCAVEFFRHREI
ncbi:fimbrial protein FimH [Klebsiella pneumoniae]|nr:fimbrial protein FimH [Klebsiella pneumoniae]